jgi:hypothetical protein
MTYDVTEIYVYTGDQIFDSVGEFVGWYNSPSLNEAFIAAAAASSGEDFDIAKFDLKKSYPVTLTWDVDDQTLTKTIQWPTQSDYESWVNYLDTFDYTDSAFSTTTINGMPYVSEPALDVSKDIFLP